MDLEQHPGCVPFDIDTTAEASMLVIRFRGELDIATQHHVREVCVRDADGVETVVLDLADLTFCDVAGLHALLALRQVHLARGRRVETVNPTRPVRRLLQVAGVQDLLSERTPSVAKLPETEYHHDGATQLRPPSRWRAGPAGEFSFGAARTGPKPGCR